MIKKGLDPVWGHFRNAEIEPASVKVPAGLVLVSIICSPAAQQGCQLGGFGNGASPVSSAAVPARMLSSAAVPGRVPPQAISDLGEGTKCQSIMLMYKYGRVVERAIRQVAA